MPESVIADTSVLIALEKAKELKKLGFYVSDGLIKEMSKF